MPTDIMQTTKSLLSEMSFDCPEIFEHMDGFAFRAFECAVFETEINSKRYDYTAYNIHSEKPELIDRRRNPLQHTEADIAAILCKLRSSRSAGKGRIEVDSDKAMRVEKIREIMYEVFREILPKYGYVVRDGQIELAEKLLDALKIRGTLLAEAAVGIGKTLAYIIVAILAKRSRFNEHWNPEYFPKMSVVEWKRMPVVVSTASIALQRAILKEAIPEVSRIFLEAGVIRKPLTAVLAKGKAHYVCEYNLRAHMPFEKKPQIAAVLRQIAIGGNIDLAEIGGLTAHVKRKICVPNRCYKNCPYDDDCRFKAFREAIRKEETDIIVCNHNLLLADAKLRAEADKSVLPPYQMLILDEAHEVLQAARSIYGTSLSRAIVPEISRAILDLNFTPLAAGGTEDWRDIRDIAQRLAEKLYGQSRRLFARSEPGADCDRHLTRIRNISGELHYVLNKTYPFKNKLDNERRIALISRLEQLGKLTSQIAKSGDNIRWFEAEEKGNAALCSLPQNLNEILYSDLWKRGVPAMLTSGTLSVGGDFSALKQSLGLSGAKRISETAQPSPYDYENNCMLYIPEDMPFPEQSNKRYIDALTNEIERLIHVSHGHSAVLFTSYYVMEIVHNELAKRDLPFPLFKLERSTSSAIEQFKKSGNGVLMASGSLWQGIDIPGDLLSNLIIAKLPFQQPDAISEYERTRYADFGDYLDEVIIPEMLIKLKQGFGRLLRSETDTGFVAILDSRINNRGRYRDCVLNALPFCPVTSDINELDFFLRSVKPLEYYI